MRSMPRTRLPRIVDRAVGKKGRTGDKNNVGLRSRKVGKGIRRTDKQSSWIMWRVQDAIMGHDEYGGR